MKTIDQDIKWIFYLGWFFSGGISFAISFIIALLVSVFLLDQLVGDTIVVAGQTRITEDYLLAYAFIPWFGIIIGVIQYLLLSLKLPRKGRMGWWILTTTIGWSLVFLGLGFRFSPIGTISMPPSIWVSMAAFATLRPSGAPGVWTILRLQVSHAAWWIPTNLLAFGIVGFIFGDNISSLYEVFIAFTVPSLFTGIVLWLLFDKLPRDKYSSENVPPYPA